MARPSIMCAIDFTHASDEALAVAIEQAAMRDAILDLIHVWYPADPLSLDMAGMGVPVCYADPPTHLQEQLDSIVVDLPADQVRRHLESGAAAEQIANKAKELESQLLVVGTHARGVIGRWFIGSVAHDLLRIAPCPILVCRHTHDIEQPEDAEESSSASEHAE